VKGKTGVKRRIPGGWTLYAIVVPLSSLMVATGLHRYVYTLLDSLGVPQTGISLLAGLLNLSWYEIAYIVGGGMKMVRVYDAIPFLGCATGTLSGVLLPTNLGVRRHMIGVHMAVSIVLSLLALMVLLWRLYRGIYDPWRILTVLAFLAAYCAWTVYFQRTRQYFRAPP
jgi:hypothetical protein